MFVDGNVMTGQSPAQASVAPSPLRQEPQVPQPSMGVPYAPPQQIPNNILDQQESNKNSNANNKYPVVKLGRLSVSTISCYNSNIKNNKRLFGFASHLSFSGGHIKKA